MPLSARMIQKQSKLLDYGGFFHSLKATLMDSSSGMSSSYLVCLVRCVCSSHQRCVEEDSEAVSMVYRENVIGHCTGIGIFPLLSFLRLKFYHHGLGG